MSLEKDIIPYVDGEGYVAPNPVIPGQLRGSDNQTMFTSEYYILLTMNEGGLLSSDKNGWETLIRICMPKPGLTVRSPGDKNIDAPDNFYGVLAASKLLNRENVAQDMLTYGIRHLGFYDPTGTPGIKSGAFQWRQPQLLFAMLCAANVYKWWKFWLWPLMLYTALVITTSCWRVPTSNSDARRLPWLLIQTVKWDSVLCRWASSIWYKRLYKDYGPTGMKAVRSIYYKGDGIHPHPFVTYSVD